jgi:small subunit ribosomal protein S1
LKQTQTDPWQRLMDECTQGDVVAGRITKVVTFGAFAEIVSGVEGLIHISELAEHHVENPREVVQQGQDVNVKIVEIDPERRRLSLSLRRVEPDEPVKAIDMGMPGPAAAPEVPDLALSEEVFADTPPEPEAEAEAAVEPEAEAEAAPEPEAEVAAEPEPEPEAVAEAEPDTEAEPEAQAEPEPEAAAPEGEGDPVDE